jgi:hypothetical protein
MFNGPVTLDPKSVKKFSRKQVWIGAYGALEDHFTSIFVARGRVIYITLRVLNLFMVPIY